MQQRLVAGEGVQLYHRVDGAEAVGEHEVVGVALRVGLPHMPAGSSLDRVAAVGEADTRFADSSDRGLARGLAAQLKQPC